LSVCLSVCLDHNSKTNDPKVFKLGVGNDLGSDTVFGFKGQGRRVSKCIFTQSPDHNSKTNDPKVFKLGMNLRYPTTDMILG